MKARAFVVGIMGALVLTVIGAIARGLGMPINLERMLGSFFTGPSNVTGVDVWLLGLGVHMLAGGVFGVLYAVAMGAMRRAGVALGAVLGTIHGAVSGVLLAVMPVFHPAVGEALPRPGLLMINFGWPTAVVFVALHVLFGMVMGAAAVPRRYTLDRRVHA